MHRHCVGLATFAVVVLAAGCGSTATPSGLPPRMLWAWDRTEDLRFLEGEDVGVAWLATTVTLEDDRFSARVRYRPPLLPSQTQAVPVVRIEARKAQLTDAQRTRTVEAIVGTAQRPGTPMVPRDFDATLSQRGFYKQLVAELKPQLPAGVRLSVTALASWCAMDPWLTQLGADEIVPMLFRLGPDRDWVHGRVADRREFRRPECRGDVGISTDEPVAWLPQRERTWIFHPRAWTRADFDALKELP